MKCHTNVIVCMVASVVVFSLGTVCLEAQQVGTSVSVDGALPNTNAILDIQSPATGDGKGLLVPRVTAAQRTTANAATAGGLLDNSGNLRGGAAQGLLVYQTDGTQGFYYNTSATATPSWSFVGDGDFMADGSVAMTGVLNMNNQAITNVNQIQMQSGSTIVGRGAVAGAAGMAVGYMANADTDSIALGYGTTGLTYSVAVGNRANGGVNSAAVGYQANGSQRGSVLGYQANGRLYGSAVGYQANGALYGSVVGYQANGYLYGSAVGYLADGSLTNVAVGYYANAQGGSERIAIGHNVTNAVDNSAAIRGNLYLDGATNVMVRSTFGSGGWTPLTETITAGDFMADGSVAMTGALNMNDQAISNVGDVIYFNNFAVGVGKLANPGGGGVAVGYMADGNFEGTALGNQANGYYGGAALGYLARGDWYGSVVGNSATARYSGIALGYQANGSLTNVAVGYYANAQGGSERIAIGHLVTNTVDNSAAIRGNLYLDGATNVMVRSTFGSGAWTPLVGAAGDFKSDGTVAMTGDLNMGGQNISGVASNIAFASDEIAIGKDATADYGFDGTAIGSAAKGDYMGVAVGAQANGVFGGASFGYQARSYYYGVAMGYQAFATNFGAAVGREANAVSIGAALGSSAKAQFEGAAVGGSANGIKGGVAMGYYANGLEGGVAIGYDANGAATNIAIGQYASTYDSEHINGGDRIAIGREVTNTVEDSCMIRGTLYLDGGTGVMYRSTFQSGGWTPLGGGGGSAISSFGYVYDLSVGGQVVAGGADVVLSNNGPLSGMTHTAGTTTLTVPNTGVYKVEYSVTISAGIGAAMAVAVNGMVDASSNVDFLIATGSVSGTAMLSLSAGDVLTIRNNSATPFTTDGSPGVGAQFVVTQLN